MNYRIKGKKVYIAGKITGLDGFDKRFKHAENELRTVKNAIPMNPAVLSKGFKQEEYLKICFAMIDVCDCVYMLDNWRNSSGAKKEFEYAMAQGKYILFEPDCAARVDANV